MLKNQLIELLVLKLQETYLQNHPVWIITVHHINQFNNRKNLSALNHDRLKMPPIASFFLSDISHSHSHQNIGGYLL